MGDLLNILLNELRSLRQENNQRFDKIEDKIETLASFKWKVIGFSSAVAFIVTLVVEIIKR